MLPSTTARTAVHLSVFPQRQDTRWRWLFLLIALPMVQLLLLLSAFSSLIATNEAQAQLPDVRYTK